MEYKQQKVEIEYEADLEELCPLDISKFLAHYSSFKAKTSMPLVNVCYLDAAKADVIDARGDLNMMIVTLIQNLYDKNALQRPQDLVLYDEMKGNLQILLAYMNTEEQKQLITKDTPGRSEVGIIRISAYLKMINTVSSAIYESLVKSTEEFYSFDENESSKRDKRTFFYILFQILTITLSVLGGYSEEAQRVAKQNKHMSSLAKQYTHLMSGGGQTGIKEAYEGDGNVMPIYEQHSELESESIETIQEGEEA